MKRDLLLQAVVGLDAKLNRIERLSRTIGDSAQFKARIPPLLADVRSDLNRLCSRVAELEAGTYYDASQRVENHERRMEPPP